LRSKPQAGFPRLHADSLRRTGVHTSSAAFTGAFVDAGDGREASIDWELNRIETADTLTGTAAYTGLLFDDRQLSGHKEVVFGPIGGKKHFKICRIDVGVRHDQ
jgi:hypothetical protein